MSEEIESLKNDKKVLEDKNKFIEEKMNDYARDIISYKEKIDRCEEETIDYKIKVSKLERDIQDLEDTKEKLLKKLDESENHIDELNAQFMNKDRESKEDHEKSINNLYTKIREKEVECQDLEASIAKYKSTLMKRKLN